MIRLSPFVPASPVKAGLLLFASGGALGWFQAPYHFWWLGFLCFPCLLLLTSGRQGWGAFWRGWLFGFGYFLFGLYWIAHALFVDIRQFWWALPLALAGLPVLLACFSGLALWATQRWGGDGLPRLLAFALFWSLSEWLRGHLFTGFPWLLYGYVWTDVAPVAQLAALAGAYGLSLWAVLLAVLPPALWQQRGNERLAAGALLLGLLIGAFGWGSYRLTLPVEYERTLTVRLVQPDISQSLKLDPAARERNFSRLLDLSGVPDHYDVMIWPETALGYRLDEREDVRAAIAAAMVPGSILLTGVVRREGDGAGGVRVFNSLMAMDSRGKVLGSYDKAHLVPFGEYIPFRRWLPFDPVAGGVDFTPGPGPGSLDFGGLPPFSPLICYEVIFPGAVTTADGRARWLVNVTNDAWYGLTHGPYQHFAISRLRAVEEGIPLVRVANNGISAVIDPRGLVRTYMELGASGTRDAQVPLEKLYTPYHIWGDGILFVVYALLAVVVVLAGFPALCRRKTGRAG